MKKKNFISDIVITFATQMVVTLLSVLLLRIIAYRIPEDGLGVYLVIRRFVGLAFPIFTLNLGISMSRFIPFHKSEERKYFAYSFIFITSFLLLLLVTYPLYKKNVTVLLFGDIEYAMLVLPTILFLYSNSLFLLLSDYYRGMQKFIEMNLVIILFWIIASITIFITSYTGDYIAFISNFFYRYTIFNLSVCCILILKLGYGNVFLSSSKSLIKSFRLKDTQAFFKYGLIRLPHGFFFSAIFAYPVFIASSSISLRIAAQIGIIITIVRMFQLLGVPFNALFLPKFSNYQANKNKIFIKKYSQMVIDSIFTFPLIIGILLTYITPELIYIWFGEKYYVVIPSLRIIGITVSFLIAYVLIRGILDGLYTKPYSNYISFSAFIAVSVLSYINYKLSSQLLGLSLSLGTGLVTLGVLSIIILKNKLGLSVFNKKNCLSLVWSMALSLFLILLEQITSCLSFGITAVLKVIVVFLTIVISYYIYKNIGYSWIIEFRIRILEFVKG